MVDLLKQFHFCFKNLLSKLVELSFHEDLDRDRYTRHPMSGQLDMGKTASAKSLYELIVIFDVSENSLLLHQK